MISNTNTPVALQSINVVVTADNVQFVFRNRPNFGRPYFGGLYAYLAQSIPTGTTTTLPIVFTSEGGTTTSVVGIDDIPITVAEITGVGIYHLFYDQRGDRLQLIAPYNV